MLDAAQETAKSPGGAIRGPVEADAEIDAGRRRRAFGARATGEDLDRIAPSRERSGEGIVVGPRLTPRIDEQDPKVIVRHRGRSYRAGPAGRVAYHDHMTDGPDTSGELDLRDYALRVAARWWIVAICVIVAVIAASTITRTDDRKLTRGNAVVYLGQPVSPNGSPIPNPLTTNPLFAQTLGRQVAAQNTAAAEAGLKPGALAGRVSVEFVSTAAGVRGTNIPLANVIVQGPFTTQQSAAAANALAAFIVTEANRYADQKVKQVTAARDRLRERQTELAETAATAQAGLADLDAERGLAAAERAALTAPLIAALQYGGTNEALLAENLATLEIQVDYIENVESARVLTPAKGSKVAPASRQVSLLAAIVLGTVVGLLLAVISTIAWPVRRETIGDETP
jgi:hypothetical protein